ncbi:MAG: class I SAM-dependent methyltransferase, partial [Lachnospiraceae bacterium]|nr:class I SAM-dependent methyltransferase [Lachnospiraceae bacterium]
AVHDRAEDAGRNAAYREKFDFCVSRAVANLSTLSEYGMPFVKQGGYFIPYKSGKVEEEVTEAKNAVKLLSGKIGDTVSFVLPNTDMERTLILIQKTAPIHKKYPRKAGTPQKEPLK